MESLIGIVQQLNSLPLDKEFSLVYVTLALTVTPAYLGIKRLLRKLEIRDLFQQHEKIQSMDIDERAAYTDDVIGEVNKRRNKQYLPPIE